MLKAFKGWLWWKIFYWGKKHGIRPPIYGTDKSRLQMIRFGKARMIDGFVAYVTRGHWVSDRVMNALMEEDDDEY